MWTYIVIPSLDDNGQEFASETYPTNTDAEILVAQAALVEAGLTEAPIYAIPAPPADYADFENQTRTGQILFIVG